VLFPSLRLGYVGLPPSLVNDFNELKALMDDHGPLIDQATLALFLESGAFYSHVRRCRRAYAERQQVFLDTCADLRIPLDFHSTDGGMNLTGFFRSNADDVRWSMELRRSGLDVPAITQYAVKPTRPGLVFGFTAFSPDVIRKSLQIVSDSLKGNPH
jgi:GntR family transcriptional regulator/MocR family aminotransferase